MRPKVISDMNGAVVRHRALRRSDQRQRGDTWGDGAGGSQALVELSIPARPEALQLARLSAGFVAAKARLDYDDVQDLRLAIDELCLSLLRPDGVGATDRLLLSYSWDDAAVEVTCTVSSDDLEHAADGDGAGIERGGVTRLPPGAISRQILDALVDDHAVSLDAHRSYGWLRKCRTGTAHR